FLERWGLRRASDPDHDPIPCSPSCVKRHGETQDVGRNHSRAVSAGRSSLRKRYHDAEWAFIEPHMPAPKALGRPRIVPLRGVLDALLYILRTACPWRLLPRDFPSRSTVQRYVYALQAPALWEQVNFLLVQQARERDG